MTTRTSASEVAGLHRGYGQHEVVAGVDQGLRQRTGNDRPTGDGGERIGRDDRTMRHFAVHHDGVTIPVSRGGRGRPLVLCPGLSSTQADLHELTELLRRDYDVVTFDLRGHGLASPADRYSFEAFLSDLTAVMAELERLDLPEAPLLVGYSLGADLAVHYASERPDTVAELFLIDGANPVPEPFITEADLAEFRSMWEEQAARQEAEWTTDTMDTTTEVLLTAQDILDLNLELDVLRSGILDQYRKIDHPTSLIMSTSIAGDSTEGRAPRHNQLWRDGIERLIRERPHVSTSWLDADHRLVFTHAPEIARIIRSAHRPVGRPTS
ncbi:alpha/beta fold hydrolase [Streptomyces sp. GS7]|uniref:alpha/beta fold hydrolase n=1 Tax=Streptomyces sp. GS7 TaxID=2692234 RepID=UPI001318AB86|nr:alpha/beta hydrolase [Streptomyces sp. GS7]QHC23186.1 alpha/beta fold hydrolase [Streptomyces sp. GS7]